MSDDVTLILEWLEDADPARLWQASLAQGTTSLIAHLRAAGRSRLAEELADGDVDIGCDQASARSQLVLAKALARYVARDPVHERFEAVDQLLGRHPDAWQAFLCGAANAIGRDPVSASRLRDRLAAEPALLLTDPGAVAMHSYMPPANLADHHARSATVRDMWATGGFSEIRLRSHMEHAVLRAMDPQVWVQIVELHSFLDPVANLLNGTHFRDISDLVPLLAAAAPAFDCEGRWLRDRFSVFPLLATAGDLLRGSAGLSPQHGAADAGAFARDLDTLMEVLSARPDWTWLGYAWLQRLAWEEWATDAWRPSSDGVIDQPLWQIISRLAGRLPPLDAPLVWIREEEINWRLNRLVAALLPLALHDGVAAAALLADAICEDFATSTMIPRSLQDRRTAFVRVLALALEALPDPTSWFGRSWESAFRSRDRLRTIDGRSATEGRDSGALAAAAACALLVSSFEDPSRQAVASDLWEALRGSVIETWLTVADPRDETWLKCVEWLALTFAQLHACVAPEKRRARLSALLNPLADPSRRFVAILMVLVRTGVSVDEIDRALDRFTVATITGRVIEDARLDASSAFDQKNALEELVAFGRKLGIG